MPLTINNKLPSINIRFRSSKNHSEISFASHIDSCAAMDVGNIRIHQWVITTHPYTFSCYIKYNDEKTFDNIALNCAVDNLQNMKDSYGKLTALVLYNTNYFHILIRYTQLDQISKFWTNVQNRDLSTR